MTLTEPQKKIIQVLAVTFGEFIVRETFKENEFPSYVTLGKARLLGMETEHESVFKQFSYIDHVFVFNRTSPSYKDVNELMLNDEIIVDLLLIPNEAVYNNLIGVRYPINKILETISPVRSFELDRYPKRTFNSALHLHPELFTKLILELGKQHGWRDHLILKFADKESITFYFKQNEETNEWFPKALIPDFDRLATRYRTVFSIKYV